MCDKYKNNRMGFALNTSEYEKDSKIDYLNEGKLCLTEGMLKNWGYDEVVSIRIAVNPTRLAAPNIMSMMYKTLKDIEHDFKGIGLMSIYTNYNREISIVPPTHVVIRVRDKVEGLKTIGILDNLPYVNYLTVSCIIKESEINDYDPTDGCDTVDRSEMTDGDIGDEDDGMVKGERMSIPRFPSWEQYRPFLDRQEDDDNDADFGIGEVLEKLIKGRKGKVRFGSEDSDKKCIRFFTIGSCTDCPYCIYMDFDERLYWCRLYCEPCEGAGELRSGKCGIINKFGIYKIEGDVCPDKKV